MLLCSENIGKLVGCPCHTHTRVTSWRYVREYFHSIFQSVFGKEEKKNSLRLPTSFIYYCCWWHRVTRFAAEFTHFLRDDITHAEHKKYTYILYRRSVNFLFARKMLHTYVFRLLENGGAIKRGFHQHFFLFWAAPCPDTQVITGSQESGTIANSRTFSSSPPLVLPSEKMFPCVCQWRSMTEGKKERWKWS